MSASRLYELEQALDLPVKYFFDGLKSGFFQIGDRKMRSDVLAMIDKIARVSAD